LGYLITEQDKQHSCFEGVIVFPLFENETGNEQVAPVLMGSCAPFLLFVEEAPTTAVTWPDSVSR